MTIIGDHTDYNGGLSLPMAIDLATEVTYGPKPGSFLVGIDSDQFPEAPIEIMLGDSAPVRAEAALAAGLLRTQPPPSGGVARVTSTIPVTGACTTPVKNAAIPTTANASGSMPRLGKAAWHNAPNKSPSWAPNTSKGANSPPGVRAA